MTVADMDRSIEFFNKLLTFEKVGEVEVHGSEYEKLQGVFGLRMRVVRMKLGEYLAPRDGRPAPKDTRANDIWHWQTTLLTTNSKAAAQAARGTGQVISPSVAKLPDNSLGITKAFWRGIRMDTDCNL